MASSAASTASAPARAAAGTAAPGQPARIGLPQIVGFGAMVFGMFMAILDVQIVASSLAQIQAGLSAAPEEIVWIQTSYLIAEVIMIPFSGFLSRLLSTRIVFVGACAGFTLASIWAGMATSMPEMILARSAQGFFSGAMIPTVMATSFTLFAPAVRDKAIIGMSLIITLAPTVGPTLGGYVTEWLSWRWLFFVNIVPGILVCAAVWRFGDFDRGDASLAKGFDYVGLVLMALFLGGLQYVLEEGPRYDWLEDPVIARVAAVAGIAGALFLWRTFTYANPIVELRAFRNRNFAIGSGLQLLVGAGLFGGTFIVPIYLAQVRHLDAVQIGTIMSVGGLAMFIASPISGRLIGRIDVRLHIAIGLLLCGASFWISAGITKDWDFDELLWPQILRSFGLMFCMPPATRLAIGTLPLAQVKNASGLYNLMRMLGGAIGLATINTMLQSRGSHHWSRLVEHVNPARPETQAYIERLQEKAGSLVGVEPQAFAVRQIAGLVQREAAVMSFADAFHLIALGFILLAPVMLLAKPMGAPAAGAPAAPTPAPAGARP